jgi:hypothetical protein
MSNPSPPNTDRNSWIAKHANATTELNREGSHDNVLNATAIYGTYTASVYVHQRTNVHDFARFIQGAPGEKLDILRGHSIGHSICVILRTVSEIELFHCTVPKLLVRKRYYILILIPVFIVQVAKLGQFT